MGSSGDGDINCSVGTIVWVRRRNGSWWPGKILGPDELLASHVMSPRSGTPVKLLGREDASVDWYNLEKSKRVKAFRCGDFDDCIERAESSLGGPSKKREKYARREDAILHALELEKQLPGKKLAFTSDSRKEDMVTSSESLENETKKHGNSKSLHDDSTFHSNLNTEVGNQVSCEDEILNVTPRMRILQDFAFKSNPSNQKNSLMIAPSSDCHKSTEDNLDGGSNMASPSSSNFLDKRKTLHKGSNVESPVKRRDRRRPLVQVLQSSEKFAQTGDAQTGVSFRAKRTRCVYFPLDSSDCLDQKDISGFDNDVLPSPVDVNNTHPPPCLLTEGNSFESTEDDESDSSKTDYLESNTEEDAFVASDSAGLLEPEEHRMMGRSAMEVEHESMSSDGGGEKAVVHNSSVSATAGNIYEWHLKGKRNIRNFTKKSLDSSDGDGSTEKGRRIKNERFDFIDSDLNNNTRIAPKRRSSADWDEFGLRSYYDPGFARGHFGNRTNSVLVDVDLKVQASHRKEHVPIVSLMSRLNGKAIIGYPVEIEPLRENFSVNDESARVENDVNAPLTPAWRTARRSANRVPRPCPSSIWDAEEHQPKKLQSKKPNIGACQKATRKIPKKVGLVSNQKIRTRTLSSIAIEQKDLANYNTDEAMKPVCGPTTAACIPVKLVFSRLFEGVMRPPLPKGSGSGSGSGNGRNSNSLDCM